MVPLAQQVQPLAVLQPLAAQLAAQLDIIPVTIRAADAATNSLTPTTVIQLYAAWQHVITLAGTASTRTSYVRSHTRKPGMKAPTLPRNTRV